MIEDLLYEIQTQKRIWNDHLILSGTRETDNILKSKIQILHGDPNDNVLINAASNWTLNFGGKVLGRYEEDSKQFALVEVYID